MLCLKKRRTYSFTQGACKDLPRRSNKQKNDYNEALNMAVTTLPRKHRSREERSSGAMVLTVTEDTPADMLAGSMELLVQLPRDHNVHTQRVTVPRSTPMMDLLVQIATAHKLSASSYTLQAIGERGLVLPHQPNTPIGALDALQVKLLPKQGTFVPKKVKQANQPFETTFRLQVLLPRNQLYVSRVSPKMNLGKILEEVCREKNLDKNKYELRHPANLEETLDLSLSLQDYHLQEVTLYAKQGRTLGAALSSQDIMALQRQEERRRQQAKQSVFGFIFRKSKESSLSIDSLGGRSVSPARSDETGRSVSPLAPPSRPLRKRRPAPKPPVRTSISGGENDDESKEKLVISHSRNSSDSSGYHEASVLSDNPESNARMPETLPRRSKPPCKLETSRKLAQTSQASKSLGNLAVASGGLSHGISSTSISSTGVRKKRAAPPPPIARPLSSAISTQALERIVDSEESLTSDIDISKSPSDIAASSKANSDIGVSSKANSDIGVHSLGSKQSSEIGYKIDAEFRAALADHEDIAIEIKPEATIPQISTRLKPSLDLRANINQPESGIVPSLEKSETVEIPRTVKRASPDRPTETDILLQKVSDTLSNSLPIPKLPLSREVPVPITSEKLSNDRHAATDESDGIRESLEMKNRTNEVKPPIGIETKNAESFLSSRNNLTCSPDATLNSQQDTSDYVSATGDDLSITDWEYQLPAPPSAFRDNISPDFDGYDTITLRSVEAFKESPPNSPKEGDKNLIIESSTPQSITPPDQAKIPGSPKVDQSVAAETSSGLPNNLQIPSLATTKVSKSPQNLQVQSSTTAKSSKSSKSLEVEHSTTKNVNIKASASSEESVQQQKPKLSSQVSIESRNAVPTTELKKEIINELSTKLGNGSLQQSTGKILETDTRRAVSEVFAPKIAPVDNTLSNFTITTYSRKKSLDIFENEPVKENCRSPQLTNTTNKNEASDFSIVSKISSENGKGNFGSKTTLNACGNNVSEEKMFVDKSESKNGLEKTEVEFKQLETKIHSTPHDSLLRNASFNRAAEKITTVHRSKSYITLANNSKYREDVNFERDDGGKQMEQVDGRIIKSTSVTNLHYETPRNNEKFSQWRENILKKQEEPSKEKQLQSLEILKNILPRLKTNQQTEENVSDPSNDQESSSHIGSKALPEVGSIESFSSVSELRAESEEPKPQTLTEEATTKRYKYTGPPAISLGSWSERPRVNVQLKMDTDYKFTTSDNTSGGKTRVNLNGTSNEKSEQKLNTLPRNFANNVTINRAIGHDESLARQKSEEQLSKKLISHTTAAGYKKPISSRIVFSETKKTSEDREDQGGRLMMSAALKKITNKKSEPEKRELEDDVRIDTKPVNFRELSKTFGEEVCLRAKPKRLVQNRHSDYYGTKPDIVQNLPINGQNSVWEAANKNALKHADSTKNHVGNGGTLATNQGTLRRYTSVVGIQSQNNNRGTEGFETVPKNYVTSTKINGLMPVVKGFKISTNEPKIVNSPPGENGVLNKDSTKNISNVPPPPTMPVITGVTLKNSSSRPKSVPICNVDPRDQLLESIRNFGGRDRLKSLNS
ncbi:cordon-bleu protein-like 1 isoform X5 [Venturia canescens]|uniref:cordon-bleu protein-like 1 isoform X5 n=1 Tax=Venturia canescens TaxID=32260 RepID=UPI001C9D416E|nr:cordon-bleu protein-like 1 isoform X5 [Venturia canescens]